MTTATKKNPTKNRLANGEAPAKASDLFSLDRLSIRVVGITPLLCANPQAMQPDKPGGRAVSVDKLSSVDQAKISAYRDEEGDLCFPNVALLSSILTAAQLMKLKIGSGKFAPNAFDILREGMTFDYEKTWVKLVHPKSGKPLTEYVVDTRRAVNRNSGGAIVVSRARFDEWSATFGLLIDSKNANLMGVIHNHFGDIMSFAGVSVAIGAFRAYVRPMKKGEKPGPGGPFGKYRGAIVD